jgi:hypothetical protein
MNDRPVTPALAPPDPLAGIELLDQEDLIQLVRSMLSNAVALTFHGKRLAKEISAKCAPGQCAASRVFMSARRLIKAATC